MIRNYNVTGEDRKRMVQVISETTGEDAVYTRMPECAYVIGGLKVSKTGELIWDESVSDDVITTVTAALESAGFESQESVEDAADGQDSAESADADEPDSLSFSFPREDFTDMALNNLQNLVASKATLIAKSVQADRLDIEIEEEKITFPWWDHMPTPREVATYGSFLTALVKMAKEAKRVTAKERETESEKYTFRVFLLRLGFIGPEHKETRAVLMKPLSGYAAFKNKADADAFYARLKEQKAERNIEEQDVAVDAIDDTVTANTEDDNKGMTTEEATNEISE